MNENENYEDAKKRVVEIKGFYHHLFVFIIVNIGVVIVNLITSPHELWFYWALLGWGIGLFAHGFNTFGTHGIFGKDWEKRQIKRIIDKEKGENQ